MDLDPLVCARNSVTNAGGDRSVEALGVPAAPAPTPVPRLGVAAAAMLMSSSSLSLSLASAKGW